MSPLRKALPCTLGEVQVSSPCRALLGGEVSESWPEECCSSLLLGGACGGLSPSGAVTLHPHLASSMMPLKGNVIPSCPTLCDPMDYTVPGILQARILEWVAFPFSRGSSQPRGRAQVSRIAGGLFASRATGEAQKYWSE